MIKTFERIERIITRRRFNAEALKLDIQDFLKLNTLDAEEVERLLEMVEEFTPVMLIGEEVFENVLQTDNTFKLLKKQILKGVYTARVVEQLVTDFRLTSAITREQLVELLRDIDEVYYPSLVEEEMPHPDAEILPE